MSLRWAEASPPSFQIGLHLVVNGPRLVMVERRHESLAVDRVAQNLLFNFLFIGEAGVVVEGVVGGALGKTSAETFRVHSTFSPYIWWS